MRLSGNVERRVNAVRRQHQKAPHDTTVHRMTINPLFEQALNDFVTARELRHVPDAHSREHNHTHRHAETHLDAMAGRLSFIVGVTRPLSVVHSAHSITNPCKCVRGQRVHQ